MSKKKMQVWQFEQQSKVEEPKPMTRKEMEKAILKRKKRPLIKSSHGG